MPSRSPRLLLDSNVIIDGLFSRFGLSKGVIALCTARTCRLVLAESVELDVKYNLRNLTTKAGGDSLLSDYEQFLRRARPLRVPLAESEQIDSNRNLIRHFSDVPVVLAAIDSKPDWLITRNREHFTNVVAAKIGIRIASPEEFFRYLTDLASF